MIECPNCSGNLLFDIPSQDLKCKQCDSIFDVYSIDKKEDADYEEVFDATIFTCPQCAGELLSTDNEATTFCSFCGASTILDSNICKIERPAKIIPFKKTKEDCKKAYMKYVSKSVYAPKELKNEKYIDQFRGIYMPYWSYDLDQKGYFRFTGTKSSREGDYDITKYYNLSCDLEAEYAGLAFDASSSFADDISQSLAPYNTMEMKPFSTSFLSGFYGDSADVDKDLYIDEAREIADNKTISTIKKNPEFKSYSVKFDNRLDITRNNKTEGAFFPVWFMSYRNGNRVAYAAVNGQTGKVSADLPVDIKKYFVGSLLLMIPIFFLLNIFFTVLPATTLLWFGIIGFISTILYTVELTRMEKKDKKENDKGYQHKQGFFSGTTTRGKEKKASGKKVFNQVSIITIVIAFMIVSPVLSTVLGIVGAILNVKASTFIFLVFIIATIIMMIMNNKKDIKESEFKKEKLYFTLLALIIAFLILFLKPVADIWYYMGSLILFVVTLYQSLKIIKLHNVLVTRELPQFKKTGGYDRA